jgi:arylsulfatase A-like enzyme
MVTGLYPHQHAASRNGLRMEEGLESLPKILARNGWQTAAFVGTWTLKHKLTLLGDHFETYGERLDKKRWFGLVNGEATGEDVTDDALEWLETARDNAPDRPFFLWVHYIEPHAPYVYHESFAKRLGIGDRDVSKSDRYDTEIAAVDQTIARLLEAVRSSVQGDELIIVFTADHGESLGEHDYWGHGRHLYEPSLRIPLILSWPGRIPQGSMSSQVTLLDVPPTLLDLVGLEVPHAFVGASLASAALEGASLPERRGCFQAHRGAVHLASHDSERKRSRGLLAVGVVEGDRKEVLRVQGDQHMVFDLSSDPGEEHNLVTVGSRPSKDLVQCLAQVSEGLGALDRLAAQKLDDETVDRLRALGYLD